MQHCATFKVASKFNETNKQQSRDEKKNHFLVGYLVLSNLIGQIAVIVVVTAPINLKEIN
ncbi:hypothetical protein BpHYR1_000907 [Brachionus plicatilis]|uniref:Uncharacterized protein n=1 Tax=Brachionus plicatilis TaxID=10195 RepID=A0A3M7SFT9_BRAPC|nr:hypothetical protein BpHYR1_000907 [Brachionus plicatilis]